MSRAPINDAPKDGKVISIIPVDAPRDLIIEQDVPGDYVVEADRTIVCSDMEFLSAEKFHFLEKGAPIKIVELSGTRDGIWRRARIMPAPPGFQKAWIGVVNLKDGKRVVRKA